MTLRDRLRLLLEAVPPGGSVMLPRDAVAEWLEDDEGVSPHDGPGLVADYTCEQIAAQLGRTAACVRAWCRAGHLAGAYRLNGREWRIPPAGLRAYLDAERNGRRKMHTRRRGGAVDLASWRDER